MSKFNVLVDMHAVAYTEPPPPPPGPPPLPFHAEVYDVYYFERNKNK